MKYLILCLIAACALPPMTPKTSEGSSYIITDGQYSGTAWVVAPHTLVTAGHMCVRFMVDKSKAWGKSSTGTIIPLSVLEFEKSDGPEGDLCILTSPAGLAPPLILAPAMPISGDRIGFWGRTSGESTGIFIWPNRTTAPCDHGDSGSAVYDSAGVWGVLVQSPEDDLTGQSGCLATTLPELRRFLHSAGVVYYQAEIDP